MEGWRDARWQKRESCLLFGSGVVWVTRQRIRKPRGASALQIRRRHSTRAAGKRRSPKTRQTTCQSCSRRLSTSVSLSLSLAHMSLTSKHLFLSEQIGWALDPPPAAGKWIHVLEDVGIEPPRQELKERQRRRNGRIHWLFVRNSSFHFGTKHQHGRLGD